MDKVNVLRIASELVNKGNKLVILNCVNNNGIVDVTETQYSWDGNFFVAVTLWYTRDQEEKGIASTCDYLELSDLVEDIPNYLSSEVAPNEWFRVHIEA